MGKGIKIRDGDLAENLPGPVTAMFNRVAAPDYARFANLDLAQAMLAIRTPASQKNDGIKI